MYTSGFFCQLAVNVIFTQAKTAPFLTSFPALSVHLTKVYPDFVGLAGNVSLPPHLTVIGFIVLPPSVLNDTVNGGLVVVVLLVAFDVLLVDDVLFVVFEVSYVH